MFHRRSPIQRTARPPIRGESLTPTDREVQSRLPAEPTSAPSQPEVLGTLAGPQNHTMERAGTFALIGSWNLGTEGNDQGENKCRTTVETGNSRGRLDNRSHKNDDLKRGQQGGGMDRGGQQRAEDDDNRRQGGQRGGSGNFANEFSPLGG